VKRSTDPDRYARAEGFPVFVRPQRSVPASLLGLAIRLRVEIVAVLLLVEGWGRLNDRIPSWAAVLVLGLLVIGLALILPTRRFVGRRALAVLTRHRLRAVFVQRQVINWTGNVPLLLWSRPTPIGERVWVLLRAGIDAVDIERNLAHIASGCHARAARVCALRSVTSIARVDVIRRDPLTAVRRPLHVVPNPVKEDDDAHAAAS